MVHSLGGGCLTLRVLTTKPIQELSQAPVCLLLAASFSLKTQQPFSKLMFQLGIWKIDTGVDKTISSHPPLSGLGAFNRKSTSNISLG